MSFIPAAFETYIGFCERSVNSNYSIDKKTANKLIKNNTNGVMTCFGDVVLSKNVTKKYEKFIKDLKSFRTSGYCDDIDWYIDSGGFQIYTGRMNSEQIKDLKKYYYRFLREESDLYEKAFILDLPLNENCFNSYKDVHEANLKSYTIAANMPDDIRKKIIYVNHFATTKTNKIFQNIFKEVDAINQFSNFAIGGIANGVKTKSHYVYVFTIPIISYLNRCLEIGKKKINIHFLGFNTPESVFFYKMMELIAKRKFDIDLKITYDSAAYRKLFQARNFYSFEDNKIEKISFLTKKIDLYGEKETTNIQKIENKLIKFSIENNLDVIKTEDFVLENKINEGSMNTTIILYMLLHNLSYMESIDKWMTKEVETVYEAYNTSNPELFNELMYKLSIRIKDGKFTRLQKQFGTWMWKTIELVESLDEDKTDYMLELMSLKHFDKLLTI